MEFVPTRLLTAILRKLKPVFKEKDATTAGNSSSIRPFIRDRGDSGGRIVKKMAMSTSRLVLAVSFGIGCAQPGIPGIYARVSSAHAWIKEEVVCDEWGETATFCDGGLQPTGGNGAPAAEPRAAEPRAAAPDQFTYKTSTLCSQSFCDAFFEDDSICTNSGLDSAFIYKKAEHCGMIHESGSMEVTCSVQFQQDSF
jgi:hypothetical protein